MNVTKRYVVDVLKGASRPVQVLVGKSTGYTLFLDKEDRFGELYLEEIEFSSPHELMGWLKQSAIVLPAQFLRSLCQHYIVRPGTPPLLASERREASIEDVITLAERQFDVSWSLSHESPDENNVESFDSLDEAYSFLGETHALTVVSGNAASIKLGSIYIYRAHFSSDGIDRGDSHINPRMNEERSELFDSILALEKRNFHEEHSDDASEYNSPRP